MSYLIIGLNGYTVCSGLVNESLNGAEMISRPLDENEYMKIGYIKPKRMPLGQYAKAYIEEIVDSHEEENE